MTKTNKIKFFILSAAAMFVFNFSASAQSAGFIKNSEKPLYKSESDEKANCYVFNRYVVKANLKKNEKEDIGTGEGYEIDIFKRDVKGNLKKSCEISADSLLNLKNVEGNEIGGVFGDLFFVRRNVFPDGGDLDVYDLETGKVVFTTEFSEWDGYDMNITNGKFLHYRQWSKKDGLLKNCAPAKQWKKQGLGIGWLQTKRLDLTTRKEISVGALRCISVQ